MPPERFETPKKVDPLLAPFLDEQDANDAERQLGRLLAEHAAPLVQKICRFRLISGPALVGVDHPLADLESDVNVQLLIRLRSLRSNRHQLPIENFRGYVASVTYNCYHKHLRQKYPERWRLKNRMRYQMNHHPGLAIWETSGGEWLCGIAAWREFNHSATGSAGPRMDANQLDAFKTLALTGKDPAKIALADLLCLIFEWARQPIEIDDLVSIVAELWQVRDTIQTTAGPTRDPDMHTTVVPDPAQNVVTRLEARTYLGRLWLEICQLPVRQRIALLLNLRDKDGDDVLDLFALTEVASLQEVADTVQMSMKEFGEIWKTLPLDDLAIAYRMAITRQQVINLRKSARQRLARRMRDFERRP